jgi:hypothetical protein
MFGEQQSKQQQPRMLGEKNGPQHEQ